MLKAMIGGNTLTGALREGLDASSQRARVTAHRIANGAAASFDATLEGAANAAAADIDLETEMVALADEQLRYDATARLLQKVYQQIRSSMRER